MLGGVGMIPVAGSPASAIVGIFWRSAFEKRVDEFIAAVAAKLDEHDMRIADLEKLLTRDLAISAGIVGARAAGGAHSQEKIDILADAVTRLTVDPTWDTRADYAMLLLQLVDVLSVTHIRVLQWLESARWEAQLKSLQDSKSTLNDVIAEEFPEDDVAGIQGIISDLVSRSLVINRSTYFGLATLNPEKLSDLGRDFLQFVSSSSPQSPSETTPAS